MPSFQGQVSEEQLNALVAYVKSLSQAPAGVAATPTNNPGPAAEKP
jgi:mono/diheme cytochrome c family protein